MQAVEGRQWWMLTWAAVRFDVMLSHMTSNVLSTQPRQLALNCFKLGPQLMWNRRKYYVAFKCSKIDIISENSRKLYVASLANDVHCNFPFEALISSRSRISLRGGADLVGGCQLPRWLRFKKFVFQNERIWTRRGGARWRRPPGSATVDEYNFPLWSRLLAGTNFLQFSNLF